MKDKINKIFYLLKKDGLFLTVKKTYKYIQAKYLSKINIFNYLYIKKNYKKIKSEIANILDGNYERIVIWRSSFGWNVPLFQRPQHISRNFALNNCLVFYEITTLTDKVKTIKKIYNNLYLFNFNNTSMRKLLFKELEKIQKPKYIQFYSTDYTISLDQVKEYISAGYKIIYEYIDDLNPLITGTKELPINIKDKYEYMLTDTENVFVVVTSDEIQKDVISKRGSKNLVFSCNGVDYNHFKKRNKDFVFEKPFTKILEQNKPIIGYYGALATWFDYEMIKYLAKNRPEYNIVLLGIKYDDSFNKFGLDEYSNIYFLGSREYNILPYYASYFDVCTIPFIINSITEATSPLKLFEYMALQKPIVTTNMKECRKYKSVMIANNCQEYLELIDKAVEMEKNKGQYEDYFKLVDSEALENDWSKKAEAIISLISKSE